MTRVAIATSGADEELDPDSSLLFDALGALGIEGELCVWDDSNITWAAYDLVVIRSTWDYTKDRAGYLAWAREITALHNPYPIIEYSTDKHYLADLKQRGHRTIATAFCDVGESPTFPDVNFVVKPTVGAGSMDAEKYDVNDRANALDHVRRLHEFGRDAMIQPYVTSVDEVGERALVFIDGAYSHAMAKGAMLHVNQLNRHARFRREQVHLVEADRGAVTFAESVMGDETLRGLLYGRVDLVRLDDGWALMELELVEPSLFLSFDEDAPRRLASAIRKRLRS